MPGIAPFAAVALAASVVVAPGVSGEASASPQRAAPPVLTVAEVRDLVARPDCGGVRDGTPEGVALREHLVAKATHESGRKPYAIRIEDENRAITTIATEAEAVREATRRLDAGMALGLGLGQITHKSNLARDFGVADWRDAVPLAFRPCAAVRAMVRHYAGDLDRTARVLDCASGAYNRGAVACGTGYARSIAAIRAALPRDAGPVAPGVRAPPAPPPPSFRPPRSAATVEVLLPLPVATPSPEAPPP